jgi:hypothetical protein
MYLDIYMSSTGDLIYNIIPFVHKEINKERLIQKWTKGLSTNFLVKHYINTLHKTPLLKWNPNTKSCSLHIGLSLFEGITCKSQNRNIHVLILDKTHNWNSQLICNHCFNLF